MNNPVQNYKIILKTMQENGSNIESLKQVRTSGLSNLELTALSLTAEYMMYNSELQIFRAIKGTYPEGNLPAAVSGNIRNAERGIDEGVRFAFVSCTFYLRHTKNCVPLFLC